MDLGIWVHVFVVVVALDVAALLLGLAIAVDRMLIESSRRWRFGLGTMLLTFGLATINLAAIAGLFWSK